MCFVNIVLVLLFFGCNSGGWSAKEKEIAMNDCLNEGLPYVECKCMADTQSSMISYRKYEELITKNRAYYTKEEQKLWNRLITATRKCFN